jgi:plastocyanin
MTRREDPEDGRRASSSRRDLLRSAGATLALALAAGCLSNPWALGGDAGTPTGGDDRGTAPAATNPEPSPSGTTTAGRTTTPHGTTRDGETPTAADDPTATATPTATPTETTVPAAEREPDQVVEVAPDGFRYAPETFEIAVGDTVHWVWKDGGHNVRVRSKPDGSPWTGTPGTDSDTYPEGYLHANTFQVAGRYEVYCAPHQSLGLEGSFEVR